MSKSRKNINKPKNPDKAAVLVVKTSELMARGEYLEYCSDCDVKKDTYIKYLFLKQELETALSDYKSRKSVRITYSVVKKDFENYVPEDPYAQAPVGGFTNELIYCKISGAE